MAPPTHGLCLTEDVRSDVIDLYWPNDARWLDIDIFTWLDHFLVFQDELNDCVTAEGKQPRTIFTTPESTQGLAEEWRCRNDF